MIINPGHPIDSKIETESHDFDLAGYIRHTITIPGARRIEVRVHDHGTVEYGIEDTADVIARPDGTVATIGH